MKIFVPMFVAIAALPISANAQVMQPQPPQQQGVPPMQMPSPMASQKPSPTQPSSAPAQPPAYAGTLTSVSGGKAQVRFADGTSQSFTVDSASNTAWKTSVGKPVAFRVVGGSLQVADDVKWGTLAAIEQNKATIQDAKTQKTVTLDIDPANLSDLQPMIGTSIPYAVNGNSLVMVSQKAPPPAASPGGP